MNTFQDLRQKLLELYKKALELYPIPEEEETVINPITLLEDKITSAEKEEYIMDEIRNMEPDYRFNFLSLLALYYYMFKTAALKNDDEEDEEGKLELYQMMKTDNINDVIKSLLDEDNPLLFDALTLILDEDIETIEPGALKRGKIEDFEEYAIIDELLSDEEDTETRDVYEQFHPNIELEQKNHKEYIRNDRLIGEFSSMTATSLADFIEKYSVAKRIFTKRRYLDLFLSILINNTKAEDKEVFNKIYLFMVKYYYIKGILVNSYNKEEMDYIRMEALSAVSVMPDTNMEVEREFVDFDFTAMMKGYYMLSEDKRQDLEKIASLDFKKTYGNEGRWIKYSENQKESIYRYNYNWYNKIEAAINEGYNIQIYYSINENDCYSIPRLCVITNNDNEIVDVLGRRERINIELEMLKTLDIYAKRFINYEDIKVDIGILTQLKIIEDKIDSQKELSKKEIDFLFEIECELPEKILFHTDIYNKRIEAKSDMKKLFAQYFDCSIDEVAMDKKELNDNTKVALFNITIEEETFPYQNLIAVYGMIDAKNITNSVSLKNIKYIRIGIIAPNLKEKDNIQDSVIPKIETDTDIKKKRK